MHMSGQAGVPREDGDTTDHWPDSSDYVLNPYVTGGYLGQYKIMQKQLLNDWKAGIWVLIWESTKARAI